MSGMLLLNNLRKVKANEYERASRLRGQDCEPTFCEGYRRVGTREPWNCRVDGGFGQVYRPLSFQGGLPRTLLPDWNGGTESFRRCSWYDAHWPDPLCHHIRGFCCPTC